MRSIASNLFPSSCASHLHGLVDRLERDLVEAPSSHSLFRLDTLAEGGVKMPLMVCGSQDDPAIVLPNLDGWNSYLKPVDAIWQSPVGSHFFHHFYPDLTGYQIQQFWQKLDLLGLYQPARAELN